MSAVPVFGPHLVTWGCFGIVAVMGIIAYVFKWWRPPFGARNNDSGTSSNSTPLYVGEEVFE